MSQTFDAYLPEIRRRHQQEPLDWEARRARAWGDARRIAALLRADFGANEVIVFGSMTTTGVFDLRCQIELGVSGITPRDFYRAVTRAMALSILELNVIDLEDCEPTLGQFIQSCGIGI